MNALTGRYWWEAEKADGQVITQGGDLAECVRFSLVPRPGSFLPRHDLAGVPMIRRLCRGFVNGLGGGLRDYVHCVVCEGFRFYVRCSDGAALVTPQDYELYL